LRTDRQSVQIPVFEDCTFTLNAMIFHHLQSRTAGHIVGVKEDPSRALRNCSTIRCRQFALFTNRPAGRNCECGVY
jgi:hypothetical protein